MGFETAVAAMGIGTAIQGGMQVFQGFQAASIAEANAKVYAQEAELAKRRSRAEEDLVREQGRRLLGRQIAQTAASGVAVGTGSALAQRAETAAITERDALRVRESGQFDASRFRMSGDIERSRASMSRISGITGGATTLLTGASRASLLMNRQAA